MSVEHNIGRFCERPLAKEYSLLIFYARPSELFKTDWSVILM